MKLPHLESIHEGEQLADNSPFYLALCLLALRSNGVDFIDEDDGRRILFRLLERFAQVGFALTSQLRHDLWTINQEKESTGLVCNCPCYEGLPTSRRPIEQDTLGGLDSNGFEQLWMAKGKLYKLADLSRKRESSVRNIDIPPETG